VDIQTVRRHPPPTRDGPRATHGVGVDIIWEARSEDTGKIPDEWADVERIEVRDYGLRHERAPERRWLA